MDLENRVLAILDLNGVLIERIHRTNIDTYYPLKSSYEFLTPSGYYVFIRPGVNNFLQMLFEKFDVGIWSCMSENNLHFLLNKLFTKNQVDSLKFVFSQKDCFVEKDPPCIRTIYYKKLDHINVPQLTAYENKTIIIDDSVQQCKYNPMFTSIHPRSYNHQVSGDNELKFVTRYLLNIIQTMEYTSQFDVPKYVKMFPYIHLLHTQDANYIAPLRKRRGKGARNNRKRKSIEDDEQDTDEHTQKMMKHDDPPENKRGTDSYDDTYLKSFLLFIYDFIRNSVLWTSVLKMWSKLTNQLFFR